MPIDPVEDAIAEAAKREALNAAIVAAQPEPEESPVEVIEEVTQEPAIVAAPETPEDVPNVAAPEPIYPEPEQPQSIEVQVPVLEEPAIEPEPIATFQPIEPAIVAAPVVPAVPSVVVEHEEEDGWKLLYESAGSLTYGIAFSGNVVIRVSSPSGEALTQLQGARLVKADGKWIVSYSLR